MDREGQRLGQERPKPMETKTKRRTFDEAFKREAVGLLLKGDKPQWGERWKLGLDSAAPLGLEPIPARRPTARAIGIYTSQERPVSLVLLPLLLTQEGGEGRGEEALLLGFPSLRLSPHSCLAGREGLV